MQAPDLDRDFKNVHPQVHNDPRIPPFLYHLQKGGYPGQRIRALREKMNLTQPELVALINSHKARDRLGGYAGGKMTVKLLNNVEEGQTKLSDKHSWYIAEALGTTECYILYNLPSSRSAELAP